MPPSGSARIHLNLTVIIKMKTRRMKKMRRKTRKQRGGLFGLDLSFTKSAKSPEPEPLVPIPSVLPGAYGWSCQDPKMTDFGNSRRYNTQEAMNSNVASNVSTWCKTLKPEVVQQIKDAAQHLEENPGPSSSNASNASNASNIYSVSNSGSEHSTSSRNTATSILRDFSNPVNKEHTKLQKLFFRIGNYLLDKHIMDEQGNINTHIPDQHNFVDKYLQLYQELYAKKFT